MIVGTGRSGSGYIARVLTSAGIRCGHEGWFNPFGRRAQGLIADSSWCAVPHLDSFTGLVWHQVRHPLDVVSSYARKWSHFDAYWPLKQSTFRPATGNHLVDAMACYVDANRTCERHAVRRWRLEDVDAALVCELGDELGVAVDRGGAESVLVETPPTVNRHSTGDRLDWDDLPAGALRDDLAEMADRYGYL